MNINYLETFLDVMETRNFNRSAERINVTQSTVSARIRALEEAVRSPLFHRGRFGAEPTAAGFKFLPHATRLRQIWNQARQELALPEGLAASVRLATQPSLRDAFVRDWLAAMRDNHPNIAVYIEADYSPSVLQQLSDGTLDIGVIYIPRALPGLLVENLFTERYLMIGAGPAALSDVTADDYVFIDWSPHFKNRHLELLPHLQATAVSVGLGSMAVDHILERGGCGYFPQRTAQMLVERHGCRIIEEAPVIEQPVYVVVGDQIRETGPVRTALDELYRIAERLG
ncbi:LysR family transcriptional regulator [Aestuariispira insulae]|uniref:DNA-binding transcriptional LysR family regulator n=1 Tax=Aestuariispira insulae TaxID=1461337 RepID=A0A3D9HEX6_9PROT|nr:LysR family transcriptional regulator [Aestuariispira insulae]RED48005.1 DNA-binding transcriptional LysR family regulator [Aestuariispira insulae]